MKNNEYPRFIKIGYQSQKSDIFLMEIVIYDQTFRSQMEIKFEGFLLVVYSYVE